MKEKWMGKIAAILFFTILSVSSSWAGQVVTDDARSWAKKAMEEERALEALEGKNTLAVLYFLNKSGQADWQPLQKGMALMLITDLSNVEGIQVVERIRLQALVEEMGLGTSGLVQADTAPRVGKLLRAQWLVEGDILKGEAVQLQVQSDLLNVSKQQSLGQPASQGALDELFRIEKDILFDVIKLLKIEVSPEKEAELRKPCSRKYGALMALFRGIDESDRGDYEKAAQFYETALQEDPSICVAADALQELKSLRLLGGKKRSAQLLESLSEETSLTDQLETKEQTKPVPVPNVSGSSGVRINPTFPVLR